MAEIVIVPLPVLVSVRTCEGEVAASDWPPKSRLVAERPSEGAAETRVKLKLLTVQEAPTDRLMRSAFRPWRNETDSALELPCAFGSATLAATSALLSSTRKVSPGGA